MQVSYRTGGKLDFPAFDLNGDGVFDDEDTLASGKQSDVGIVPTLSILLDNDTEIAYGSGSSGAIDVIQLNPGSLAFGRQSWRQLR
jgi:type IV pilus assembly protein PilY1